MAVKPPSAEFDFQAFHRLIPSCYSECGGALAALADDEKMLQDLMLVDGASNDHILGEQQGLVGISPYELVYGIPHAHNVNAAFTHTSQSGARFSDNTRGAWYAAEELQTSLSEVSYHKAGRLMEVVVPELPRQRPDEETATYDDWLADFRSTFHVLKPAQTFAACLEPEPMPQCYRHPQQFARLLLEAKSNGLVYPGVRREKSRCLVCFRPALVSNPRRLKRLAIQFKATAEGYQHSVRQSKF